MSRDSEGKGGNKMLGEDKLLRVGWNNNTHNGRSVSLQEYETCAVKACTPAKS